MMTRRRLGILGSIKATIFWCLSATYVTAQQSSPPSAPLDCLIEPRMLVKLGSPVEGIVERITVDRGDFVERGHVVAELESGVERASVALARERAEGDVQVQSSKARLEFERRKRARAQKLFGNKVVSDAALDEAVTDTKLAELQLREAEFDMQIAKLEFERSVEMLKRRTIHSPMDGVIVKRSLSPGEYAHEQAEIATIAQLDPLKVEVFVPVAFYARVKQGMSAEVRPEEPVGGVYLAEVAVVDRVFDAASGTFGVQLELPNPDRRLPAGLRCKVHFRAE